MIDTRNLSKVNKTTIYAMGIALYVAISMALKIPFVGHTSLDLGYIVFAFYCYFFGITGGMIVGCCGCTLVSLLGSGWFPTEWIIGQAVTAIIVGWFCYKYRKNKNDVYYDTNLIEGIFIIFVAVFVGIGFVKTGIALAVYQMAFWPKFIRGMLTALMDTIVMSVGYWFTIKVCDNRFIK